MRGSKREKPKGSGRWELRIYLGRDPYKNKQLTLSEMFYGSGRDADSRLAELVVDAEAGRLNGRDKTLGWVLEQWLDHLGAIGRSPTTLANYRSKAGILKGSPLGQLPLVKLTAEHINGFYRERLHAGNSPRTVFHYHRILTTALRYAEKQSWVNWGGLSPAEKASPPTPDDKEAFSPSVDQVLQLITAAEESRQPAMADFYRLAALTGMRRGELCGLRWSDINWSTGVLTVQNSVYQIAGELGQKTPKNRRKKRIVVGDAGIHLLQRLWDQSEAEAREARVDLRADGFVFSSTEDGSEHWTPNGVTQFTTRIRNRLQIPDFHLHSLRHWSSTALVDAGIDIRNVAGRLGHQDGGALLLNRYAHRREATDKRAGQILATLLALPEAEPPNKS
jgi:integrase